MGCCTKGIMLSTGECMEGGHLCLEDFSLCQHWRYSEIPNEDPTGEGEWTDGPGDENSHSQKEIEREERAEKRERAEKMVEFMREQLSPQCNKDPQSRYYDAGGIEVLDIIRAKLTPEQFKGYCLGNMIKYTCRANFKGSFDRDIQKTGFYEMFLSEATSADSDASK